MIKVSYPFSFNDDDLRRPLVDSGIHVELNESCFYIQLAVKEDDVLGPPTWKQVYLTSDNRLLIADPLYRVLLDESGSSLKAVRRWHGGKLIGLKDENRCSEQGIARVLAGDPAPDDIASKLTARLRQHVLLPEPWQYCYVATWVVATYLYKLFPVFPFLLLMSREPGCGKTKLLAVLERLCFNASKSNGLTKAMLERATEFVPGTLLLDELEGAGRDRLSQSDLNEALNSKFDADARQLKLVPAKGGGWETQEFRTFAPLVFAKLSQGGVSDTVLDRSIVIRMKKLKGDFNQDHPRYDTDWADLRDDLYLWALRKWEAVWGTCQNDSEVRQGLNRKADIWRVMLSVGKVLLPQEEYRMLLEQARAPEPDFDPEDIPLEYEPIAEALEIAREKGTPAVKATDLKKRIGDRLAPHIRGHKAFIEALKFLEDSHHIAVRPFGPGKTAHVFFLEKPTSST